MLLKVNFLGHEIGYNTIKPIHSKSTAYHQFPSPTGKVTLMSFFGALNFYTKLIDKLNINLKPFYDLLHENTPWNWTNEHECLFQKIKTPSLLKQNLPFQIQNIHFYYSRRFANWIRRCHLPTQRRKQYESHIFQISQIESTRTKTIHT